MGKIELVEFVAQIHFWRCFVPFPFPLAISRIWPFRNPIGMQSRGENNKLLFVNVDGWEM
jgi:hypothetical protein